MSEPRKAFTETELLKLAGPVDRTEADAYIGRTFASH
jgi:hypothetical protein